MGGSGASWPWLMVSGASMGCSCKGFRLVSACRGMVVGTAPSGFLDRVPCQRFQGPTGPFGGGYAWALSSLGVETGASGGLPVARCTSNAFLCAISARCGNRQKKRPPQPPPPWLDQNQRGPARPPPCAWPSPAASLPLAPPGRTTIPSGVRPRWIRGGAADRVAGLPE